MKLNTAQRQAIDSLDHNLQIVACAGSGKTEVIARRIVNILLSKDNVTSSNIVAFTFTNLAADNMRSRIERIIVESGEDIDISEMYIGTIHSFCKMILDNFVSEFEGYRVLDTVKEHIFMRKYYNKSGAKCLGLNKNECNLYATCFDKMIYMHNRKAEWTDESKEAFEKYCELLNSKKYLNFSLLIFEVLKHFDKKTIQDFLSGIKYLVVDEYQDVDDLQESLINKLSSCGANLCVVGDDDQTIYQFRGSNAENMINFQNKYPNVEVVNLDINYRSEKSIIDVADMVIKNNINRLEKKMLARDNARKGNIKGICAKGDEEYEVIAKDIQKLYETGVRYSDMAILLRKRSKLNNLINKLDLYGVPYMTESNDVFFESEYYKKFCNIFKYLNGLYDENLKIVVDDWKELVEERKNLIIGIRRLKTAQEKTTSFVELFEGFIEDLKCDNCGMIKQYTKAFSNIASDFDEIYSFDSWTVKVSDFIYFIEKLAAEEYKGAELFGKSDEDAIHILTVHKAKGLEFDAVFIPDLQQGFFPSQKVGGKKYYSVLGGIFEREKERFESTVEDERKLFYVALTRAKNSLYLYSNTEKKEMSQFLREMQESEFFDIEES